MQLLPVLMVFLVLCTMGGPAAAAGNITVSFVQRTLWGTNPVEITNKSGGELHFYGDTGSKGIPLLSSSDYIVQFEPGGFSDYLNCPDYGMADIAAFARKNVIGIIGFVIILIAAVGFLRKTS